MKNEVSSMKKLYDILAARDGERCAICGEPGTRRDLAIDDRNTVDGKTTKEVRKMRLICQKCRELDRALGKAIREWEKEGKFKGRKKRQATSWHG